MKIVTSSQIQQDIWIVSDNTEVYTVIKRGEPKTIIIPYSEKAETMLDDYLEDLEIEKNNKTLKYELKDSLNSWLSNLSI